MKSALSLFLILSFCCLLSACGDDDKHTPQIELVTNAGVTEAGQTVRPGDIVHLYGEGFEATDCVEYDFRWDTGEALLPEGFRGPVRAEITERHPDGLNVRMPHRMPPSRVDIYLRRQGDRMLIGNVQLADGQTPKDFRLYAIGNEWQTVDRITTDNNGTAADCWSIGARSDFHSVVNCAYTYGLCGLSEEGGIQQPFFLDFCTGEWKALDAYSPFNTLALIAGTASNIGALQTRDGKRYSLRSISADLERSNYAVPAARSTREGTPYVAWELPDGLTAGQFGDYPGAFFLKNQLVALSAKSGEGRWTPVLYGISSGFHVLEPVEADALIPYSFSMRLPAEGGSSQYVSRVGYVISSSADKGGSRFYLLDEDTYKEPWTEAPLAVWPDRVISVSHNFDRPGTFTVLYEKEGGCAIADYDYNQGEWTPLRTFANTSYSAIAWGN